MRMRDKTACMRRETNRQSDAFVLSLDKEPHHWTYQIRIELTDGTSSRQDEHMGAILNLGTDGSNPVARTK